MGSDLQQETKSEEGKGEESQIRTTDQRKEARLIRNKVMPVRISKRVSKLQAKGVQGATPPPPPRGRRNKEEGRSKAENEIETKYKVGGQQIQKRES